jgi:GNAT superfamily N-acetyltransferase
LSTTQIHLATTDAQIEACFAAMHQLRPHLLESEFVSRLRRQQSEGYNLAYIESEGGVEALAGFRIYDMLFSGRTMYVDDLVAHERSRGSGHASALFDWLIARAKSESCAHLTLDSGFQRQVAHRFYFHKGMTITSFHFSMPLQD